jgi:hypothetical protein
MEGKVSPHQLTGTRECFEQKRKIVAMLHFYNKAKFILQFLLLSIPSAMPGQRAQTQQPTSHPQQQQATGHLQ